MQGCHSIIFTWMSLCRLGGKEVKPWLEQSAVILPDIHRHRHRAGQEERKSHLDKRITTILSSSDHLTKVSRRKRKMTTMVPQPATAIPTPTRQR